MPFGLTTYPWNEPKSANGAPARSFVAPRYDFIQLSAAHAGIVLGVVSIGPVTEGVSTREGLVGTMVDWGLGHWLTTAAGHSAAAALPERQQYAT